MTEADRTVFYKNVVEMVNEHGLGECKESDMRRLFKIVLLCFEGTSIGAKEKQFLLVLQQMVQFTYSTEYCVCDSLHFFLCVFAYFKLFEELFQHGERGSKHEGRNSHFHNWIHHMCDYQTGVLTDQVCQHKEVMFKAAKDSCENTN